MFIQIDEVCQVRVTVKRGFGDAVKDDDWILELHLPLIYIPCPSLHRWARSKVKVMGQTDQKKSFLLFYLLFSLMNILMLSDE